MWGGRSQRVEEAGWVPEASVRRNGDKQGQTRDSENSRYSVASSKGTAFS